MDKDNSKKDKDDRNVKIVLVFVIFVFIIFGFLLGYSAITAFDIEISPMLLSLSSLFIIYSGLLILLYNWGRGAELKPGNASQLSVEAKRKRCLYPWRLVQMFIIPGIILLWIWFIVELYVILYVRPNGISSGDIVRKVIGLIMSQVVLFFFYYFVLDMHYHMAKWPWMKVEKDGLRVSRPNSPEGWPPETEHAKGMSDIKTSLNGQSPQAELDEHFIPLEAIRSVIWSTNLKSEYRVVWLHLIPNGHVSINQDHIVDEAKFKGIFKGRLEEKFITDIDIEEFKKW
jgi:hypothetical protein